MPHPSAEVVANAIRWQLDEKNPFDSIGPDQGPFVDAEGDTYFKFLVANRGEIHEVRVYEPTLDRAQFGKLKV